ncbi:class I SAM-dependent methyltransferase [Streptomyces sp. AN091965]|uniref:class I SAM-dependent methyltransferase n=1 Tax=Streptomyces sp. AN091965 TaxID=2927803 RepID=UPI001F6020B5|nr:class I SAM-dependent methyltransferase [Streptomyces sp. AN091965]MCI3932122.1 class I SAM-dependent methyltransferase [Streptomyces sp. AN091965]
MPTLPPGPPEQGPPREPTPHQHRDVAESFGADAARYDRARPRYPQALVDRVVGACPGPDVVDVGTGTGIAARQFQAAGCRVLGVEVDPRMAALARRRGLTVEVAAFEEWNPAGRVFDAVVSGQTWHWVDPVAGAARAARTLRPGGRLAVFWNAGEPPADLVRAFAEVYRRLLPDSLAARQWAMPAGDAYAALALRAVDGMRAAGSFGTPEHWRFAWERDYSRDEWLDQVPTTGGHTGLPAPLLEEVLAGVGAAVDAAGGGFTMRYTTVVATAART